MKALTIETLLADQKERIYNCRNSNNDVLDFINEINENYEN